jgi:hypothetical protein
LYQNTIVTTAINCFSLGLHSTTPKKKKQLQIKSCGDGQRMQVERKVGVSMGSFLEHYQKRHKHNRCKSRLQTATDEHFYLVLTKVKKQKKQKHF